MPACTTRRLTLTLFRSRIVHTQINVTGMGTKARGSYVEQIVAPHIFHLSVLEFSKESLSSSSVMKIRKYAPHLHRRINNKLLTENSLDYDT